MYRILKTQQKGYVCGRFLTQVRKIPRTLVTILAIQGKRGYSEDEESRNEQRQWICDMKSSHTAQIWLVR